MRITITDKDFPDIPTMNVDDTGEIELTFKVVGVSRDTLEPTDNSISYELECVPTECKVEKVSLEESTRRAADKITKIHFTPSPS